MRKTIVMSLLLGSSIFAADYSGVIESPDAKKIIVIKHCDNEACKFYTQRNEQNNEQHNEQTNEQDKQNNSSDSWANNPSTANNPSSDNDKLLSGGVLRDCRRV